jgi:hypothetical protein
MAKSFRRFRDDHYDDDEWGTDDEFSSKRERMKARKQKQKQKFHEKMSNIDDTDDGD